MNDSLPRGLKGALLLLERARDVYDAPDGTLAEASTRAWRAGFASGGEWMRLVLSQLRVKGQESEVGGQKSEARGLKSDVLLARSMGWLGVIKYGLACAAALPFVVLAFVAGQPLLVLLCVPAFYAVEAQMVFLFPLALDGNARPYAEARRWTGRAGGTLVVMSVVLPLAATMLFGGFFGRGFLRCWCLGCLAVCIWYEQLRDAHDSLRLAA